METEGGEGGGVSECRSTIMTAFCFLLSAVSSAQRSRHVDALVWSEVVFRKYHVMKIGRDMIT